MSSLPPSNFCLIHSVTGSGILGSVTTDLTGTPHTNKNVIQRRTAVTTVVELSPHAASAQHIFVGGGAAAIR